MNAETSLHAAHICRCRAISGFEIANEVGAVVEPALMSDARDRTVGIHNHPMGGRKAHVAPKGTWWLAQMTLEEPCELSLARADF